jgi:oligosaccharide repeat unit polymerase
VAERTRGCADIAIVAAFFVWAGLIAISAFGGSSLPLSLAPAALIALPFLLCHATGRRADAFDPLWIFSATYLFTYGLVPSLQLWKPAPFESVSGMLKLSPPHYLLASVISGLAFVAFLLGYFTPWATSIRRSIVPRIASTTTSRVRAVAFVLIAFGVLSLVTTGMVVGVWDYSPKEILSGELRRATVGAASGRGYLTVGYLALSLGIALVGVLVASTPNAKARPMRAALRLAGVAAVAVLLFAVVLGSRQLAVVTCVQLLVVFHLMVRPIGWPRVALTFAALAVASVVFISLRNYGRVVTNPVDLAGLAAKTFDGFNFLVSAVARVADFGFGRSLAEDIGLTYVPRAFFPGKPEVFGISGLQEAVIPGSFSTFGGLATFPPGIVAEGYLNFGVLGALLLPAIAGFALRTAYDAATASGSALAVVLFGSLIGNQTGLFRGFGQLVIATIVVLVLLSPLVLAPRVHLKERARAWARLGSGAVVALLLGGIVAAVDPAVSRETLGTLESGPGLGQRIGGDEAGALKGALPRRLPAGGVTLLLVTSSWCPGCPEEVQAISSLRGSASPNRVVALIYQEGRGTLPWPSSWAVVRDEGQVTLNYLHAPQLPTIYVLDRESRVACRLAGTVDAAVIGAAVDAVRSRGRCA